MLTSSKNSGGYLFENLKMNNKNSNCGQSGQLAAVRVGTQSY
jgi:hypothetical protein